jgi:hypothetical protein
MPDATIHLERLKDITIEVKIEGVTPLIPHKWSEKARKQMLDKQKGKAQKKLAPKNPKADAEACLYKLEDGGIGMPAVSFKAAIVGAARNFEGVTLVSLKQSLYVGGEGPDQLVRIKGKKHFREDAVRNSGGGTDLRHRYAIWPWSATLFVTFVESQITTESVLALADAGGRGGIGDWRPSSPKSLTGTFGTFRVVEG